MGFRKILQLFTLIILYGAAVFFCFSAKGYADKVYLLLEESIDPARAEEIFSRESALAEPIGFCFWGEADTVYLSCTATGGIAEAKQFLICGNPELLDAGVLAWQKCRFFSHFSRDRQYTTA